MSNWIRSEGELPVKPAFWLWFAAYAAPVAVTVRGCVYVPPASPKAASAAAAAPRTH